MITTILKIEGMMCPMCEAHIADTIRRNFEVKKVKVSRRKKEAVIESETALNKDRLEQVINETGYELIGFE